MKQAIRYSHSFKMEAVRELEKEGESFEKVRRKYGVKGTSTVQRWVRQYGTGKIGGMIRMEKPEEINELARLKKENRKLKEALADAHIDLAMEKECAKMLADMAGVKDLEGFKKNTSRKGTPSGGGQ